MSRCPIAYFPVHVGTFAFVIQKCIVVVVVLFGQVSFCMSSAKRDYAFEVQWKRKMKKNKNKTKKINKRGVFDIVGNAACLP